MLKVISSKCLLSGDEGNTYRDEGNEKVQVDKVSLFRADCQKYNYFIRLNA